MSRTVFGVVVCLLIAAVADRFVERRSSTDAYNDGVAKGTERGMRLAQGAMVSHDCGEFYRDDSGKLRFRWFEAIKRQ